MEAKKSKGIGKKEKKILILLGISILALILIIGIICAVYFFRIGINDNEPQNGDVNTLYVEEIAKRWGGRKRFDGWVRGRK